MTRLPMTFKDAETAMLEAEALAYTRHNVRMIRDEKIRFFGLELSWLAKADNRRLAVQMMKNGAARPLFLMDLCNLARAGWPIADEALRELIVEYQSRGEPMPTPLAAYTMEIADPRQRWRPIGGPEKADTFLRDIAITFVVGDTSWKFAKFGLKPTRQVASRRRRPSGCSIAARAMAAEGLAISEATVARVWTKFGWIAFPGSMIRASYPMAFAAGHAADK
jgi:hypothetical protein